MILKRCVAFALLLSLLSFLPSSKAVFSQGTAQITDLAWSQDGSQLAVGRGDGTIDVVSRVGQPTATLSTGTQAIRALSWNPIDNNVLAASIYESTDVQILNIGSGGQFQIIRSLSTDQDDVRKIVWNKGGTQLATLGEAEVGPETVHTVQIWDTNTGNLLASYQDGYLLTDIAWNPQNSTQLLITGVADDGSGEILLWNAVNQTSIWTKDVTNFGTSYVAWNPDGSSFVVATNTDDSSPTQIYDSATGTVIAAIPTSHNPVVSVSWSPGSELALGGSNGIEVWNPATLQLITQVQPSDYGTIVVWSARNELAYDAGSSAKILTGLVGGATSTPTFTDTPTPTATVTLTPTLTPTNTPTPTPTQCSTASSIASNFNGTAIGAGRFIWFSSHFTVSGQGANAITISIRNQTLQFTASGTSYSLPIPDALVTIDPSASSATTTFDVANSRWVTTAPKGLSGDTFMTGLTFLVPSGGLPGGINPVTWSGQFSSNTAGLTVNWQWAAAVYTSFSQDYSALGVKPVDSNTASQYHNSDHAGTPENFKVFVIGGARGGGGSNYTGGNSGTGSVNPCH